jgi:glycolate oxidase subunit GlcD
MKIKMSQLIENLRAIVGRDSVLSEHDEMLVYECDGLPYHKHPPCAVVFPRSTEEVSEVVKVLNKAQVSFSPRGAGTGLSGGALAVNRGVIIELAKMKRILKIDVNNRIARVEVGLVNAHLSRAVARYGLHYVPDPSSQMSCTIGGNIAENAGGVHCLKYGVTTDHVLAARVVLSDGEVVDFNLNDEGYDLLGVFVGSEGTFGLATEATLKLTFNPPAVRTILAEFTDIDKASHAVSAIIAAGMIPAALEMIDGETIRAVEASIFKAGLSLEAEAALLIELDGLEEGLDDEAEKAESLCKQYGASSVRRAKDEYERKKLWAARKSAIGALGRVTPDLMLQDAVVPRSCLPEVLAETYRVGAKYNLRVANVFHAGDGNLHPIICFDSRFENDVNGIREAGREIMQKCVSVGGTITGEHGVGLDKSEYMPLIFSDDDMETMLRVRAAFDPTGLCNPGKIIPMLRGCGEKGSRGVGEWGGREDVSTACAYGQVKNVEIEKAGKGEGETIFLAHQFAQRTDVRRTEFVIDDALKNFASIVGDENVSVVDSYLVIEPSSFEEASECLHIASLNGWRVSFSNTHKTEIIISTERMNRIISHEPSDLVATVEAGCSLSTFNQQLSQKGQWLPIESNGTIGSIVATGVPNPLSFGYGRVRSQVLGMRVALSDGRIIKAGGRVVKNVAGYDLCKLFTGSHGTLGLILETTFKLKPLPEKDSTVVVRADDFIPLIEGAKKIIFEPLLPVAVELLSPKAFEKIETIAKFALLIRFIGSEKTVSYQVGRASEIFKGHSIDVVDSTLWQELSALNLKTQYVSKLGELDKNSTWHFGVGDNRLCIDEDTADSVNNKELMRRIKEQLDPNNLFVSEKFSKLFE